MRGSNCKAPGELKQMQGNCQQEGCSQGEELPWSPFLEEGDVASVGVLGRLGEQGQGWPGSCPTWGMPPLMCLLWPLPAQCHLISLS